MKISQYSASSGNKFRIYSGKSQPPVSVQYQNLIDIQNKSSADSFNYRRTKKYWKEASNDLFKMKKQNNFLKKTNQMQSVQIVTQETKIHDLEKLTSYLQEQLKYAPNSNPYMIQKMNTNSAIAFKLKEKIKILKQDLLNKDKELDEIKMHIKYTKLKELAVERQLLKEECQRLKLALKQKNYVPEGAFKVLQNDTELKGKINILEIDKTNMSEEIKRLEKNCKNEIEKSLLEKKKFEKEKKLLEQNLDKTKNDNIEMKLSQTNEKLKLGEHLSKKVRNFEKDLEVFHKINQRIKEMFGKIESITEIIQILKSNIRSNKEKMNNKQKKCMKLEEQCSSYKIQITKFASILNLKKIIIKNLLANNFSHDELKEFISNIKEKEITFNFVFELLTKHPFEIKDSEQATLITNYIFAKDKLSLKIGRAHV